MSLRVKICGITNLADARYCAGAGADYLGFIQYAGSPRFIDTNRAREIIEWVYGAQTVGVFVNAEPDTVNRAADQAGFDLVQLHGDETPDVCEHIERPVIKAFGVDQSTSPQALHTLIRSYDGVVDHILLDSRLPGQWGGTGRAFDWSIAQGIDPGDIFLAGGISPSNAAEAVRSVQPFALDVSSGLESAHGQKDFDLVEALFDVLTPFRSTQD
jgi:phosphoribosylanthranilate isomerase